MNMETVCGICSSLKLSPQHKCPPLHFCREHGSEGAWKQIHAGSLKMVAEIFAERLHGFQCERPVERVVEVRRAGSEEIHVFDVGFDSRVSYCASERSEV